MQIKRITWNEEVHEFRPFGNQYQHYFEPIGEPLRWTAATPFIMTEQEVALWITEKDKPALTPDDVAAAKTRLAMAPDAPMDNPKEDALD